MTAKNGDTVKIHYNGTLNDGSVFDSSLEREPLEFVVGSGTVIPGIDNAIKGMETGDEKTLTIPSEEAYGPYRNELVIEVDKDEIPSEIEPKTGMVLQATTQDGGAANVVITSVEDATVTLDANHPLAGKDLTFQIKLMEIS